MGGIRTQSPRFASMFLLLVLASVALPTTFNFVGSLRSYTAYRKLMYGLPFRRNDYHLGAYYMLKMYQQVMLGETNTKRLRT
jgi:NADH-quinone oxidoreductase subunit M